MAEADPDRHPLDRFRQDLIDPGWRELLVPAGAELRTLNEFVTAEAAAGRGSLPEDSLVLRVFQRPPESVKVLILGQDPYPTPGHPIGLSFAVAPRVRPLPRSLINIYRELHDDLGVVPPDHGDLSGWSEAGVMLLNRVLTVRPGESGSHRGKGWETVTEVAIRALVGRKLPLVAVLWGKDAASAIPFLGDTPVILSAHPSPLSAARGFFGSRPFSRVNALLAEQGAAPIRWELPSPDRLIAD